VFIHIGNRQIISGSSLIGIFNRETLEKSSENGMLVSGIDDGVKSLLIDAENRVTGSNIGSFTIIKRITVNEGFFWRRKDD